MVKINPETQKTRKERLATVIAIGASTFVHIFVIIGGFQLYKWSEEEEKRERLMVIRRIQETTPEPARSSQPAPARRQAPPQGKVKEQGEKPPDAESSLSENMVSDITEDVGEAPPEEEVTETAVSVVTDLSAATFTITGPSEFHGAGTFWTRKGAPEGGYSVTFHPVPGYKTPPIQSKDLADKSKIVFVGKYTRSIEVKVLTNNIPGASFDIVRPDGLKLGMTQPGRAFFEDLPPGNYTIRFHDVPGYLTPPAMTRSLGKGGGLDFAGSYLPGGGGRGKGDKVERARAGLDRRVQMIVKSYPATGIEENFDYIRYPEIIIKRSNFQKGWCRVYLVLRVDGGGRVSEIEVERPREEERSQYSQLISTVESAVKRWRYDPTQTEVHVDVRFYVE